MVRRPYSSSESSSDSEPVFHTPLLDVLAELHADEFVSLTQRLSTFRKKSEESWIFRSLAMVQQYITCVVETWLKAAWACVFYPTTIMDRIAVVIFSFAACTVMSVLLPWCLLCNMPLVQECSKWISRKTGNVAPTIFGELTKEEVAEARKHLSKPIDEREQEKGKRVFNLDAAKLLLQCATHMYERTASSKQKATSMILSLVHDKRTTQFSQFIHPTIPGAHIRALCGISGGDLIIDKLRQRRMGHEEETIQEIASKNLGLQFLTISELNNLGSSYCGLFWRPGDTFIIVGFRGTNPTDFMEWNTDFTYQMHEAGQWLRGFGKVHDGFMKKVFPTRASGSLPYDTIIESIKRVADELKMHSPGQPINVWVTGHSLGCALASLVYSRMIFESHELGEDVFVRDAYIFAAPILCDVKSAQTFNNRMNRRQSQLRTLWRVTNGNDIVATGLPEGGDNVDWTLSPWNLFSFAHLGCEIKLRDAPQECLAKGNLITPGTHVVIESAFDTERPKHLNAPQRVSLGYLQRIPVVGRLLAHSTSFYWASLQGVKSGKCTWLYD